MWHDFSESIAGLPEQGSVGLAEVSLTRTACVLHVKVDSVQIIVIHCLQLSLDPL